MFLTTQLQDISRKRNYSCRHCILLLFHCGSTSYKQCNTITTVGGAITTNVNTVGGAIANVNTVASNVAGVNSFADRYRVGASDPSSSLDAGDLAFNTTANVLKYYDGAVGMHRCRLIN